jgi:hypothetical protein
VLAPYPLLLALVISVPLWGQAPAITPRGIVNAASLMPGSLPGGKLAPGARIVIPGIRLSSPGGPTRIHLEHAEWQTVVTPAAVSDRQLEAILPNDTPPGDLLVSVATPEGRSRAESVEVSSAPAIFTLNGQGWGPVVHKTVARGASVTIRVNGLHEPRPNLFVAGERAAVKRVRPNELTFAVPRNAPEGCATPVWIESSTGTISNFGSLAIQNRRGQCEQPEGWPVRTARDGARVAVAVLTRVQVGLELVPGRPANFAFDGAAGLFFKAGSGSPGLLESLPPAGACAAYTSTFTLSPDDVFSLRHFLGSYGEGLHQGPVWLEDDAQRRQLLSTNGTGEYSALLSGKLPVVGGPGGTPFLTPGEYFLHNDNFRIGVRVPPSFDWTNRASLAEIDRSAGFEVTWTSSPERQMIVAAFSMDGETSAIGSAVCTAPANADRFRFPARALANFPASSPTGLPVRMVVLISVPRPAAQSSVNNFDEFRAAFLEIHAATVRFR